MIEWAIPFKNKIYFNILNHPDYLNIRCLPFELKLKVEKTLKQYYDLPRVKGIVDYMFKEDWTNKLDSFYHYTNELDVSRKQNLYDIVPELRI